MNEFALARRSVLQVIAGFFCACGSAPLTPVRVQSPTQVEVLANLVPAASLRSLLICRPREVAQTPFLIPALAEFAQEEKLDAFQTRTGFDIRQVPEALYATFDAALGEADLWIVRYPGDLGQLERQFGRRLTSEVTRDEDRHDVVRLAGKAGSRTRMFGRVGRDLALFQEGGDRKRGPGRIAILKALGKLPRSRPALSAEPLGSLVERFGSAPAIAVAPGPFDSHEGAAGTLLSIATGVGAAARPTARENIGLAVAVAGDFGDMAEAGSERLLALWERVAHSPLGRVLGIHEPIEKPFTTYTPSVVALSVEVDEMRLARGLKSLLTLDVTSLMKL